MVSRGCVGVLTFGEPTGLELPEVDVPGNGRLLPIVGETDGGVTDDMMIVGGVIGASRVRFFVSRTAFVSTVTVEVVVIVVDVFESTVVTTGVLVSMMDVVMVVVVVVAVLASIVFASMLLDRSVFSIEFRVSRWSLTALLVALSVLEALGL